MKRWIPTLLEVLVLTIRKGIKTKSSSSTEDTVYLVVLNGHFIFRTPTAKLDVWFNQLPAGLIKGSPWWKLSMIGQSERCHLPLWQRPTSHLFSNLAEKRVALVLFLTTSTVLTWTCFFGLTIISIQVMFCKHLTTTYTSSSPRKMPPSRIN